MSKISVFVATYDEDGTAKNQAYLDLCLQSLTAQTYRDFEVVVVSSGETRPILKATGLKYVPFHSEERLHFPPAIAKAYELSNKNSEYILLLNDDVILRKDCIEIMHETIKAVPHEIILNPLSNSESKGFFYNGITGISKNGRLQQFSYQYRINDAPPVEDIINHSFTYAPLLIRIPFNPFFCTMMKRSTYDKVGGIDPRFLTNKDDLDFSIRAHKLGIMSMAELSAFCFHFGGVTSSKTKTKEEELFNIKLFNEKHESK